VEVLAKPDQVAQRLIGRGLGVTLEGLRMVVGPGDQTVEQAVLEEVAAVGSGLVRMVRGSASLEDLFLRPAEAAP
jgi:hypothetical protein